MGAGVGTGARVVSVAEEEAEELKLLIARNGLFILKQAGFEVPHSNWDGVGLGWCLVWVGSGLGSGLGSRLGLGCIWIRIGSDFKKSNIGDWVGG